MGGSCGRKLQRGVRSEAVRRVAVKGHLRVDRSGPRRDRGRWKEVSFCGGRQGGEGGRAGSGGRTVGREHSGGGWGWQE